MLILAENGGETSNCRHMSGIVAVAQQISMENKMDAPGDSVDPDNAKTEMGSVKPTEWGLRGLKFLTNAESLRASAVYAWSYARHCVLAACVMAIVGLVNTNGTWLLSERWKAMGGTAENPATFTDLISVLSIALGMLVVLLGFVVWGFGLWLMCLSRFLTGYLSGDIVGLDAKALEQRHLAAREFIKTRKKFLAIFWLVVSAIGFVPVTIDAIAIVLLMPQTSAIVPRELTVLAACLAAVLTLTLLNYSFVAMAVSCVTTQPPAKAAWKALMLTLKTCPGLSVISILMLVTSTALSYPQLTLNPQSAVEYFSRSSFDFTASDFITLNVLQLWQGLLSVFFITWWFGVASECVRGSIE